MPDANALPSERLAPIEVPGWGPYDRRSTDGAPPPPPDGGVKWASVLLTLLTAAVASGVAWGTATATVHQKVDKAEQAPIDVRQDAQLAAVLEGLHGLKMAVDSANLRLQQMACQNQPPSCR